MVGSSGQPPVRPRASTRTPQHLSAHRATGAAGPAQEKTVKEDILDLLTLFVAPVWSAFPGCCAAQDCGFFSPQPSPVSCGPGEHGRP